jgi:hypothetical protein
MYSTNNYEGLDPLAVNRVRERAQDLVRTGAIPEADLEDAEQELMLHALKHVGKHDAGRGKASIYYDRIVSSKARHIAERHRAQRRAPEREALGLEYGLELSPRDLDPGLIDEQTIRRIGPEPAREATETTALRIDVRRVVERLSPDLQRICRSLIDGRIKDIVAESGVSRAALDVKLAAIRTAFEEAGLRDYLPAQKTQIPPFPVVFSTRANSRPRGESMDGRMVTTYTMWSLFRNCRKAVEWRYIEELVPLSRDANLGLGTVIHKCLELWHGGRGLDAVLNFIDASYPVRATDDEQRREWHLATAMMRAYAAKYATEYFEVVALEQVFEGEIVNPTTNHPSRSFLLKGKVDGIVKRGDEYFLLEHKTASQVGADYLERLWTDFQITLYAYYVEKALGIQISGVIYNILGKARLQQSKGETEAEFEDRYAALVAKSKSGKSSAKRRMPETDEEFQARLAEKYAEPDMLHREVIYLSREQFRVLQRELWDLTQSYLEAKRRKLFYQNTSFCFHHGKPCPFYALCRSGGNTNVIENFYQRVPANEELRGEADPSSAIDAV